MELQELANELVAGCRSGHTKENLPKLYAADAVSVEAVDMDGSGRDVQGVDAIRGKHEWWEDTFEVIEGDVSDPMMHGDDRFAVIFTFRTKEKSSGEVSDMKEVAIYHVKDGKIVREEFFYSM